MLQNYTTDKVAEVFFRYPTGEHYLKGISREIKLAHTSVRRHLEELKKASLIKERIVKKGKREFPVYISDNESKVYRRNKAFYNLISLYESGLVDFLYDSMLPKCILVFGSYSRGEDIEESDIDIFLECEKKEVELANFEKKLCRKIQLHFNSNFKQYPIELKNNIINGIVLRGFLEGYK